MLPVQFIFHHPRRIEVKTHQTQNIQWMWLNNPAKVANLLHSLQATMGPGVTMLQGKGCPLHWTGPGSLSLQLSQRSNVAVRADGLSRLQEIQKDHPFPTPKDNAHLLTHWWLPLELCLWWEIHLSLLYRLLFWLWFAVVTPCLITGNYAT